MAYSFMGIGRKYYGHRHYRRDGSFVTTEWVILFYFPVFPVCSLRVRPTGKDYIVQGGVETETTTYEVYEVRPTDVGQAISIYAGTLLAIVAIVGVIAHGVVSRAHVGEIAARLVLGVVLGGGLLLWAIDKRARARAGIK